MMIASKTSGRFNLEMGKKERRWSKAKLVPESICAGFIAAISVLFAPTSQAQTLDEITVTAQKRAESSQDVPIAITAHTEDFLEANGIAGSDLLAEVTPGLTFGRQLSAAVPFMRGVGTQTTSAGQDGSVSTYVDGVYHSSLTASVLSFGNVERVEVLKGPQGTLFGRNATGGLMHVITRDPSGESQGHLRLAYGSYDTFGVDFYGDVALSDNVAVNLAVNYADQGEGFGTNLATGNDVNQTDELMIRNKWAIDIGDNTTAKLTFDLRDIETSIGVAQQIAPGALGGDGLAIFSGCVANLGGDPSAPTPAEAGACAPIAATNATTYTGDLYNVNADTDPRTTIEQWGVSARIEHSFEKFDMVSITAFRDSDELQFIVQDQTPLPGLLNVSLASFTRTFTQELQLVSSGKTFDWIVGVYYLSEEAGYDPLGLSGALLPPPASGLDIHSQQDTDSIAVFGQIDYDIGDATTATIGLRYTEDERSIGGRNELFVGGVLAVTIPYSDEESWSEPTWRLALSHSLTDDVLIYGSYNRGFNGGSFNTIVDTGVPSSVNPEILDAYEVGVKSEFRNNSIRLNAAAFYYDFQDLQVSVSTPGGNTILNAAEATMSGAELELTALVGNNWSIHSGLSLLNTEYDSFPSGPTLVPTGFGGNVQIAVDSAGNEVPRSPEYTFNIGAIYNNESVSASVNYYYNDGFFWESENRLTQDSYSVVNARVGWTSSSDVYNVELFANNLTDEEYSLFGISSQLGDFTSAAAPRTYGLRLGVNF